MTVATALALVWGGWCTAALLRLRPAAAARAYGLVARPSKPLPPLPTPRRVRAAKALRAAVDRDVADVVALVGLAVSSGCNLSGALAAASTHSDGPLAGALRVAVVNARRGTRIADALEALPAQLGEGVRPFVAALVSCDRYGAALGPTLDRLAVDVRTASRQRAEAAARQLPVRLLFPLVSCILPAFALLTVAPLIAGSVQGLSL